MYLELKPVLYVIDASLIFQIARFLNKVAAKEIREALNNAGLINMYNCPTLLLII